jgi:drug/metabolite transporter (DMT)-like permease
VSYFGKVIKRIFWGVKIVNEKQYLCPMKNNQLKWAILAGLSFVWGSSFILMKLAMINLSATQVGALRMIISALFLLVFFYPKLKLIDKKQWKVLFYLALAGTFIPTFLFTFAIQHIDSGIVAILNSFTPLNTLLIGFLFFHYAFSKRQMLGIVIGIIGTVLLVGKSAQVNPDDNYWYALLVLAATIGYAINVNVIKKHLSDLDPISIAVGNFVWVLFPALVVLYFTGFFQITFDKTVYTSLGYVSVLAIVGTALAMIFFNKMVHIASPIFAASVTYTIPIIALLWGLWDGEHITVLQILAGAVILLGVYVVNSQSKIKA